MDEPTVNGGSSGAGNAGGVAPDRARPLATEWATYLRELPRLVGEGEVDRFALIAGGDVVGVWDTYGEALQAGYERYGLGPAFAVQRIDARDLERFGAAVGRR
jgi:hypothetical protein